MFPVSSIHEHIRTEVESLLKGFDVVITKKLNKIRFFFKKNYPDYKLIKSKKFPKAYYLET